MKRIVKAGGVLDPASLNQRDPLGEPWSQAALARGELLFVSGQCGQDASGEVPHKGDMLRQTELSLRNLKAVLESAGGRLSDVVSTTWFVVDAERFYSSGASGLRRKWFKGGFPASTLVEVCRLAHPEAIVEVQAVAVLPGRRPHPRLKSPRRGDGRKD